MAERANHSEVEADSGDDVSIEDLVLQSPPAPDRLPPMLFLAALVHGILIIGITFNAVLGDEFREAVTIAEWDFEDATDVAYDGLCA